MKRSRADIETDLEGDGAPALKKAKTGEDIDNTNYLNNFNDIPSEIWREVAQYCVDVDPMSNAGGYFATFPLLTTCKSISKAVADLPLWRFLRELKKVTIPDDEWTVKNGCADFQWNTRIVYGKTFLRMLNTISTRLKQRRVESVIKEHRKQIPALKNFEDFVVFDAYLNAQATGITEQYDEFESNARIVSAIFTLNFSALESVKLYFYGLTHNEYPDEYFTQKIAVIETSHELKSLKGKDFHSLLQILAKKLKMKVNLFREFFFTKILEFPVVDYVEEVPDEDTNRIQLVLHPLVRDIEFESYKLSADEKPHPAESLLIEVLDQLQETKLFPNMPAMNLINAILRSSYKIGAKKYAQWFIEDNQLEELVPRNFLDTVSWLFMEWRSESVALFSIQTKESGRIAFRLENGLNGFFIEREMGDRLATAYGVPYQKQPRIIAYQEDKFDAVQAECGCEKLSRDMFLALLFTISNMDTERCIFVDPSGSTPLELVRMKPLLDTKENDGTSDDEDEDEEANEEEDDLNEELKDLKDDFTQHFGESIQTQ